MTFNDIEIWSTETKDEEKEISFLRYTHKAILTVNVFAHKLVHCVKNLDTMAIGTVCTDRALG